MSAPEDRIPVPTNGHHAPLAGEAPTGEPAPAADAAGPAAADPTSSGSADARIVISPTQLAVGFGILAGAILLLLGRRRGRRG